MPLPKFDRMRKEGLSTTETQSQSISNMMDKFEELSSGTSDDDKDVKIVPRSKIVFHKNNDYSQKYIEKLADSILHYKLQNIISGYYDEELDVYVVENGERRTRALDLLIETYTAPGIDKTSTEYQLYCKNVKKYERGYRFLVQERRESDESVSRLDELMSLLRLEAANLEVRFDADERANHIQKRIELLQEYNALVETEEQINIADDIAQNFDISKRQAFKYTAVTTNLIPELQEEFQKKNINLNSASSMAALPEETQHLILEMIRAGEKVDLNETKEIQEQLERLQQENERMLQEKEKQIAVLIEEKSKVESSVDTIVKSVQEAAEKEQSQLRAQLEEEIRKEIPSPEKVTVLEKQLEDTAQKHQSAIQQLEKSKRKSAEKDVEIAKLKSEMEEMQKGLSNDEAVKRVKAELGYQSVLKLLNEAFDSYKAFIIENREVLDVIQGSDKVREDIEVLAVKIKDIR